MKHQTSFMLLYVHKLFADCTIFKHGEINLTLTNKQSMSKNANKSKRAKKMEQITKMSRAVWWMRMRGEHYTFACVGDLKSAGCCWAEMAEIQNASEQ